jgi:hypothetical protein
MLSRFLYVYILWISEEAFLTFLRSCFVSFGTSFEGWNELLIAAFSHRSVNVKNAIVLASGLLVERQSAHGAGVGPIFDRVLSELVTKMREMKIDKTELGCLRAIILFNSG